MKALCLLGTLKKGSEKSNTEIIVNKIFKILEKKGVKTKTIRLSNYNIKHGIKAKMGDDWPKILKQIIESDIVIFATPIWWGTYSSQMQKVMERMTDLDDVDESYKITGRALLKHKVAGVVVTGAEDGAQHIVGMLSGTLMWYGFCIPPMSSAYWVGEVGRYRKSGLTKGKAVKVMIEKSANNLYSYAKMISENKGILEK